MKVTPRVYLISSQNSQLCFDKLSQAAKRAHLEIEAFLRSESVARSFEFTIYNHGTPTFVVIEMSEVNSKTAVEIVSSQLKSAVDQLISKATVYYPSVILIGKSPKAINRYFSVYDGIVTSVNNYDKAIAQISKLADLRTKKYSNL
ncbi:MAG: hypothetical protein HY094_06760 [Candidatus Melainabacteria bacterium]|nr:hypothetical protein [Candidatus Melainabacteria bacterium]